MNPSPSRLIVLGAGAIGAGIGGLLHEVGLPVVLVARGEHGRALARHGLDLRLPGGARQIAIPTVSTLVEAAPTPDDLVMLATMGQDSAEAMAGLDPRIAVASFQNGTAPADALLGAGHSVIAAMVYVPADRRGPGTVALTGHPVPGTVLLGAWPTGPHPWAAWLAAALIRAGFRAEAEPDVGPWVRAKLVFNLGGIVTALCDEPVKDVVMAARAEARAISSAQGLPVVDNAALLARVGPLEAVPVDGILRIGGSTRSALDRGAALETASLHGPIVAAGRALGVPTPVNTALISLAERAHTEGWRPGALSAAELRREIGV